MLLPSNPEVSSTEALPVRLHLRGAHAGPIERWVLSVGWQPVTDEVGVRSALTLADVPAGNAVATMTAPTVLLVADDPPQEAATAAVRSAAVEVVRWPQDRAELPEVARRALDQQTTGRVDDLRIAGAAGGVGTSTVAAGLAGLCAWRGRRTLLLRPAAARSGPAERDWELEGAITWRAAEPAPGIGALRLLDVPDPAVAVTGGPAQLVVRDLGVTSDTDVLVVRRDRPGLESLATTSAGVIVVRDDGPAPIGTVRRAAGGRRVVVVPWSARVARAGLRGRVPGGLPGSWLGSLAPVVGQEPRR